MDGIYLDHAATTPMHPDVLAAMMPFFREHFGNPSSIHSYGRMTRNALNQARDEMADRLGCEPRELIFTSGGTESDHLAIRGAVEALPGRNKHIITSQVEHHAVLGACQILERTGCEVTYLPVDEMGLVDVDELQRAIRPDTVLISIMYGNNEVGTIQPIEAIGQLARERQILFHVDAVQALGMVDIHLKDLPVDLMSFSAHKIHGPKGVGALYIGKHVKMTPLLTGGAQERNHRAGTENVAGIVGFAKALQIATEQIDQKAAHLNQLRQAMLETLSSELNSGFVVHGHPNQRLPHILNISFPSIKTETLLMNLDLEGIAASSGSACSSGSLQPSHVLQAMGRSEDLLHSAIRFSFGMGNTIEEAQVAARKTATIVNRLRNK